MASLVGGLLGAWPELVRAETLAWSRDAVLWKRRVALICQLQRGAATDEALLFACITPNLSDREFFIRKAIGWALRQYARVAPDAVRVFVAHLAAPFAALMCQRSRQPLGRLIRIRRAFYWRFSSVFRVAGIDSAARWQYATIRLRGVCRRDAVQRKKDTPMSHDVFDVYATIIKDTNEMNDRRRQLDSLYVTLITVILTGDAYVAFFSAFNNWLLVIVTIGVSVVGATVTTRWRAGLHNIDEILNHRYQFLRGLEETEELRALGASVYSAEWESIYKRREARRVRSVTNSLQLIFIGVFILIPIVLTGLTAVETIPALQSLVPPAVMQHIGPLAPSVKP